jgi:23S rRNA pseudouridine1911/1915/1917 synthase
MTDTDALLDDQDDELFEHHRIVADPKQSSIRIDKFLMARLPNYRIRPNDIITVSLPEPPRDTEVVPENIPLSIVFEDQHLMVINKPAGMVVHPAYQNWTGTLVNALAYHFKSLPHMAGNEGRPGLVHRIDKDTSGLLVVAKDEETITGLAKQFFDHTIERRYYALVWGIPDPPEGTIDQFVGRSLKDRRLTTVFPERDMGRNAVTHYRMLQDLRYVSVVECKLETGRTHQIRAHMKYIGHTLFNDAMYGGDQILKGTTFSKYKQFVDNCFKLLPRQALHAKTLGFVHPITKKFLQFDSELPQDIKDVIEKWENYVKYN